MLTIRQLFYYLTGAYITLLLAGLLLTRWFWFYPIELENYLHQQQKELHSLSSALHLRQQQLLANAIDYSHWTETWNFVQHPDQPGDFLQHNFTVASMDTINLDAVVILNSDYKPVLAYQLDEKQNRLLPAAQDFYTWIPNQFARENLFLPTPTSDILRVGEHSYLLASSPVLKTDHQGPQAGWLLFFQRVDDQLLTNISDIIRIGLREIPLHSLDASQLMPLELPIYEVAASHQRCVYNSNQVPVLCLELQHDTSNMPEFMNRGIFFAFMFMILMPALLFAILLHQLTAPIRQATSLLQRNNSDGLLRPVLFSSPLRVKELRQLRNAFNELVYTTRQQQAKLEQLSNTDRLTNIANRRAFDETLDNTWRRLCRHSQQAALVLCDIDYFKAYNDHYGHQAGDDVLHKVAQALKGCARRTDEIAARFGGEEFVLILYVDNDVDMHSIRERIQESIRNLKIPHGYSNTGPILTLSFGVAWIRDSGAWLENYTAADWLHAADSALYAAKGAGRNCSLVQIISADQPFTDQPKLLQ